jgi:hypothetical protein
LTFARETRRWQVANVKFAPLAHPHMRLSFNHCSGTAKVGRTGTLVMPLSRFRSPDFRVKARARETSGKEMP